MEIPLANPDVVVIVDINSTKHSTDVKNHGHFQGVIISHFFWGFRETLVPLYFFFVENLNAPSLVSTQFMHFPSHQHLH